MSRPFFVLVPVRTVVPAGQRIEFYKPQDVVRWEDQFSTADLVPSRPAAPGSYMDVDQKRRITREPSVVLELANVTYDTTDPDFDPKRNYLTGITSGVVVREVPVAELRQDTAA